MQSQHRFVSVGTLLAMVIGLAVGYGIASIQAHFWERDFFEEVRPLRIADPAFPLIHRLIAYEVPQATAIPEYAELRRKVQSLVNSILQKGDVQDLSVYYRSVETGRWVGVNENESYYPASLLKVPLMLGYFKARETDPGLFSRRIVYEPGSARTDFEAESTLVSGKSYTVLELLEKMIIDSDNGAAYVLFDRIDQDLLASVYERLGVQKPGDDSSGYEIPTKIYALFFRTLYNGTYLRQSASEEALEMLSKTTYREGLVAGVAEGTIVAHKFGEHIVTENGTPVGEELHDCGIIYKAVNKPAHPYILCVMTRAKTLEAATAAISTISKLVYESESAD